MAVDRDKKAEAILTDIKAALADYEPGIMGEQRITRYSILVPLLQQDGQLSILFEKRASTMRRQAGEICFPGGRIDPEDATPWDAARRETSEELGLAEKRISYLGELDRLVAPAAIIYPFVGLLDSLEGAKPNPDEVEEVFCVPLATLLGTEPDIYQAQMRVEPGPDYPYHLIPGGKAYPWRAGTVTHLFYHLEGHVVWGLTARVLAHLIDLLRNKQIRI
ncbi:CoA pyrophosphatase [Brevibacillus composti]|uniref:CoA pyrophosphatase n=1 Tax=Brevibacillus composti TaxID=2796470 RepID=A0A7T5EML5_9BACL|nr:CoA pyrophosphatase [Brevibacillus composti]QQE75408.1 CoA pyrophosphatase [Brevibacillus composti]QUO42434.1 CoA pyrophosphatase [Brevibacillus composti]